MGLFHSCNSPILQRSKIMKTTVRHELLKPKAFCRESVAECIGYMIDTDENGDSILSNEEIQESVQPVEQTIIEATATSI